VNGYVEAGYIVILGSLSTYAAALTARERAARLRLGQLAKPAAPKPELELAVSPSVGDTVQNSADAPGNETEQKGPEAAS